MEDGKCPHCGASLKQYWHTLTPGLVKTLVQVYLKVSEKRVNQFGMKEIKLTHSQYGNFQKLRFHAMIAKIKENGEVIKGQWLITGRGVNFLTGKCEVPERVQTFRNKVIDHSHDLVNVTQVMKDSPEFWETDFDYSIFAPAGQQTLV